MKKTQGCFLEKMSSKYNELREEKGIKPPSTSMIDNHMYGYTI